MRDWKSIIQEQSEIVREEIKTKFKCSKEETSADYERTLKGELKEFLELYFSNVEIEVGVPNYTHKMFLENQILNDNEFRKAVVESVFPLALEYTEAFNIEENSVNAINNIKKILEYSPESISTVMPVIEKLDKSSLESILEQYPQFENYILENIKEERETKEISSDQEVLGIDEKLKEIKKKFDELVNGMEDTFEVETVDKNEMDKPYDNKKENDKRGIYKPSFTSEESEKLYLEEIEKIKSEIKRRFYYSEENYSSVMNSELQDYVGMYDWNSSIYNYYDQFENRTRTITNRDVKFREAVVEAAVSLSLENTDWFEKGNKETIKNIEKILDYSPNSITTVMPMIKELEENDLNRICEQHPQLKEYILLNVRGEENEGQVVSRDKKFFDLGKKLTEINKRFEELVSGTDFISDIEGEHREEKEKENKSTGSIREKLENLLKGYMDIFNGYEEFEIDFNKEIPNKGINK